MLTRTVSRRVFVKTGLAGALGLLVEACAPQTGAPAGGAPAGPTAAPIKVTFGVVTDNLNHWPVYIADEEGLFGKFGVEFDRVLTRASASSVQLLSSGSVPVATATADAVIAGAARGGGGVVIVAGFNRAYYVLVAKPQIKSYADLKGKVIGVSALRAGETPLLRVLLRARGLAEGDYQMVVAGGTPERVTALQAGSIDATMLTPPLDLPLVQKGFTRLGASTEVLPDFAFLTLGANRSWASANSEALVRVLAALTEATAWLLNPANKNRAVEILAKRLNVSADEARQTYEGTVAVDPPLFYRDMALTESSLQKVLEFMVEDGTIQAAEADPKRYLDTSYLAQALQRRGVRR